MEIKLFLCGGLFSKSFSNYELVGIKHNFKILDWFCVKKHF